MNRLFIICLLGILLLALPGIAQGAQFNVTDPTQLQTALTTAQANGEDDIINVAAGTYDISAAGQLTYEPTENKSLTITGSQDAIFNGGHTVRILSIDTSATADDSNAHVLIQRISFRYGRSVGADGGGMRFDSVSANLTVEESEFRSNHSDEDGGALDIQIDSGDIIFTNNTFDGNNSDDCSGAVDFRGNTGSVIFSGNTFSGNISDSCDSGAMYIFSDTGDLTISDNTFQDNQCTDGPGGAGHIHTDSGSLTFDNNVVDGNSASNDNGGFKISTVSGPINLTHNSFTHNSSERSGGARIDTESGEVTLTDNLFYNNSAVGSAPDTGNYGGLYVASMTSPITLVDNIITGNSVSGVISPGDDEGTIGGAMLSTLSGLITLSRNVLVYNTANNKGGGGAVKTDSGDIIAANNIIFGNTASLVGGGFGFMTVSGQLSIINNTIFQNEVTDPAAESGGLYIQVDDGGGAGLGRADIYNNIVWGNIAAGNGADIYIEDDRNGDGAEGIINLFNNDFSDVYIVDGDQYSIGDNIDSDPLFSLDLHIPSDSPCIDAGDNSAPNLPATDYDGNSRILDGDADGTETVDMGADEHSGQDIDIDSTSIDFGDVLVSSDSEPETVTISNVGDYPLSIVSIEISGSDAADFSHDAACNSSPILGGQDCSFSLVFTPSSEGEKEASVVITSDDPDEPTITITLSGNRGSGSSGGGGGGGGCFISSSGM
jgi:hypothetical protein